jgi:hypothetical protein
VQKFQPAAILSLPEGFHAPGPLVIYEGEENETSWCIQWITYADYSCNINKLLR